MHEINLNDTQAMRWPHPVRVDHVTQGPYEQMFLEQAGVWEHLKPYLADESTTTEWLLNNVPGMSALAHGISNTPGSLNLGLLSLILARARLRAHQDPLLQVTPWLQQELLATDMGDQLPVSFLRSPYTMTYIELHRPSGLQVFNRESGWHEVEGAYIGMYTAVDHHPLHQNRSRVRHLRLDPRKPTRVVELVITGSPAGKRHVLDDASQNTMLFIQDEDEALGSVLQRHEAYNLNQSSLTMPSYVLPTQDEVQATRQVIQFLIKVLLYLNLPEAQQQMMLERTELQQRIQRLGPKKSAKLSRRLSRVYDRILIGPPGVPQWHSDAGVGEGGSKRPHWRRGHFRRILFGQGKSESKLGWIKPVLVNADQFGHAKPKVYQLR